jgi:DNA primase
MVSLAQHGIDYAVATLGTAFSDNHLQILLRSCNRLIFCFDADAAGRRAAWKALTLCLKHLRDGLHIHFLFLPEGEDPDSLVQKIGKPRFEKRIKQATSLTDFLFEHLKEETPPQSLAHKAEFAKQVSTLLNTMPEGIFRELLYQRLAQELDTSLKELNTLNQPSNPKSPPLVRKLPAKYQVLNPTDLAISLLLQNTELAALVASPSSLHFAQHPRSPLLQKLIEILQQKTARVLCEV